MIRRGSAWFDLGGLMGILLVSIRLRLLLGIGAAAAVVGVLTEWIPILVAFPLFLLICFFIIDALLGRRIRSLLLMARMGDGLPLASDELFQGRDELARVARAVASLAERMRRSLLEAREQTSKLEEVFSAMGDGVLIVDADGRILKVNNTARRWLGVYEDVTGRRVAEITRSVELAEKIAHLGACLAERSGSLVPETIEALHLQGTESKVVRTKIVPTRMGSDRWVFMVFLFDMTDFHRVQEIRREFFANASHELKTPLAAIRGYAETLQDFPQLVDVPMAQEFLEIILRNSHQLTHLVDEMLLLARMESGALPMDLSDYNLVAGVERVFATCRPKAEDAGVELCADLADNATVVRVDPQRFESVLLNLVDNGIKYNRQGGVIKVSSRAGAAETLIHVEDSGIGIPDAALPRAFERFYRVDKSHSRLGGGSGLGLAVVKHIVTAHGGTITVRSEINVGTVFTITLPRQTGTKRLESVNIW